MIKIQQNISTNFPNFKKKINHFHFHKKIIKMITYFFIFGSNNYLRQQISFNQKRGLEKICLKLNLRMICN
ncbi:hypothetical protein HMPREF0542_12088 [Ligilactobacillus ruminis ATCC 25644]|uniref:Uncharacterized protein n=1 Tax=Ligilactobacillus ruminis ATCC 25644 TaxID=525362 RepID=E7FT60_9LACO|nr:hypothetical protein HMPREF0542_12088 [Ligilactobacillus ruminis ATCC 25644]EGX98992.1 hypothetical protein ANHS_451 [Ligilactobacillus ruminis ATCC 25644]